MNPVITSTQRQFTAQARRLAAIDREPDQRYSAHTGATNVNGMAATYSPT